MTGTATTPAQHYTKHNVISTRGPCGGDWFRIRSDINHHIGTVSKVTEERVGVELHGAVWETSGGDAGNEKAVANRPAWNWLLGLQFYRANRLVWLVPALLTWT